MPEVYVGIGSNVDPESNVRAAVAALADRFRPLLVSPVYASPPVGYEGPEFLNLVVAFETVETAAQVAAALDALEQRLGGGVQSPRFSPRAIDLDLLLYGDLVSDGAGLKLPRTDIREYAFVLCPLADLAPDGRHPETGERFADMWRAFPAQTQPLRRVEIALP